jgi:uncharacterized protein DUF4166
MMPQTKFREAQATPETERQAEIGDLRFRALLPRDEWESLPPPIRKRFSKRVAGGHTVLYAGEVVETRLTFAGRIFAQVARLAGGPLPLSAAAHLPAVVTVTEDARNSGQIWTRLYARRGGVPQVIHSSKQFAGETGLEEHVGSGIGMALVVHAEHGALVFRSARYFFRAGLLRFTLPRWLTPGALTVTHAEEKAGRFSFLLEVVHPAFGLVIRQLALFHEVTP